MQVQDGLQIFWKGTKSFLCTTEVTHIDTAVRLNEMQRLSYARHIKHMCVGTLDVLRYCRYGSDSIFHVSLERETEWHVSENYKYVLEIAEFFAPCDVLQMVRDYNECQKWRRKKDPCVQYKLIKFSAINSQRWLMQKIRGNMVKYH